MRFAFLFVVLAFRLYSQTGGGGIPYDGIVTNNNYTEKELVNDIFLKGGCAGVENIQAIGNPLGIGYFENADLILGMGSGIILATGPVNNATGPNQISDTRGDFNDAKGDKDLEQLAGTEVKDVVGLSFEFVPLDEYVTFRYVFASEEYCEFVNSEYNDAFGFFVSGPGINGDFEEKAINAAVLPNTEDYVSINNINHLKNEDFYVSNHLAGDDSRCGILFTPKPLWGYIEYDGFTTVLSTTIRVIPCERYKIKLVVADVGDHIYDSAVFLEAKSFSIGGEVDIAVEAPIRNKLVQEGCGMANFVFTRTNPDRLISDLVLPVRVSANSTAREGEDYAPLPNEITIPAGVESFRLPVTTFDNPNQNQERKLILELDFGCNCLRTGAELVIIELDPFNVQPLDTVICKDYPTQLSLSASGGSPPFNYSYGGLNNQPNLEISTSKDTLIQVKVQDLCGQSDSVMVDIRTVEPPTGVLIGGATTCEGDSILYDLKLQGQPPFYFTQFVNGIPQDTFVDYSAQQFVFQSKKDAVYTIEIFGNDYCPGVVNGSVVHDVTEINLGKSIAEPACSKESDGSITLNPSGGSAPYQYFWDDGNRDPIRNNLPSGNYAVTVMDNNQCEKEEVIELYNYSAISAMFQPCITNDIPIKISGGFPPYQFSTDKVNFENEGIFNRITPGDSLTLWIADENECRTFIEMVMPYQQGPFFEGPGDLTIDLGQSIELKPIYYIPLSLVDSITWSPQTFFSCSNCQESTFSGLNSTDYEIILTDNFGCQEVQNGSIEVVPKSTFFIPDAFSPNGDGINDHLFLFVDKRQIQSLRQWSVFDRWGNRLHYLDQWNPNSTIGIWDGGNSNPGTYLYQGILQLVNGDEVLISGSVQLIK